MTIRLKAGDTVGIVSPSIMLSPRKELNLQPAISFLQNIGFNVVVSPSASKGLCLTPDSDRQKSLDIMEMYQNPRINALFAAHGGAASLRLLPYLDYKVIKNNPKPLIGFSDTSSVQMGIFSKTQTPYISGFLCEYDFRNGFISPLVEKDLTAVLSGKNFTTQEGTCLKPGVAQGTLLGGNLSILSDLNGTPYYPDIRNAILLLEDECEKPYKISLMLTQLRFNPLFKQVKGVIFGRFSECVDNNSTFGDVNDILLDFANKTNIPVIKDFNYGHFSERHVLTFGVPYKLNAEACRLEQIS